MRRTTRYGIAAAGTLALLALPSGCGDKEWTRTPDGFVKVDDGAFAYKAVSPDGSTIAIRHRGNEEEGSLAFWAEVFELELVQAQGYKLAAKAGATSADGVPGTMMTFELAQGDTPYHYGLALYVTPKSIVTVETATELSRLNRYQAAFDAARRALKARAAE
jgi:hypothetical protein